MHNYAKSCALTQNSSTAGYAVGENAKKNEGKPHSREILVAQA